MDDPKISHMKDARRIIRYLNGTMNYGLLFPSNTCEDDAVITCYSDSDWCGDNSNRRSTTGYFSRFLEHQSHGAQRSNRLWHCLHVKLNTWQDPMRRVKQSGLNHC